MHFEEVLITPEKAAELLASNHERQRNMSKVVVQRYLAQMLAGNWKTSPHGIVLNKEGKLVDGQHRMEAVRLSGQPFTFVISHLDEDEPVEAIDRGSARTIGNVLEMKGVLSRGMGNRVSSIARAMLAMDRGVPSTALKDYESVVDKVIENVGDDICDVLKHHRLSHMTPSAMIAAVAYVYPLDKDRTLSVLKRAFDNDALERDTGVWHLNRMIYEREVKRPINWALDLSYRTLRCYQAEFDGKKVERIYVNSRKSSDATPGCLDYFRQRRYKFGLGFHVE